jgi:ATP-dependent RNA helicase RhlE
MSFNDFKFHPKVHAGIVACGYKHPTPIQQQAIKPALEGRDILGLAQTGTGKTAAFVLPILQRLLDGPRNSLRALIVAPTRELAEQINENITAMARETGLRSVAAYGGVGRQPQIQAIRAGAEIVVACPGRLLDILNEKGVSLNKVETLVLDEADHMFDKGFLPDIRRIIKQLPAKRQSLVFSATMPAEILRFAESLLVNPVKVQINRTGPPPAISHTLFQVANQQKTDLLKMVLAQKGVTSTLVFTKTKHKAKSLAIQLEKAGYTAAALQGNMSQSKRQKAMDGFRDGTFTVLVATDIAARGIDVAGVSHVINYDMPDTAETYTHRTGRTARASLSGQAISFANQDDGRMVAVIERNLKKKMLLREIPGLPVNEDTADHRKNDFKQAERKIRDKVATDNAKGRKRRAASFDFGFKKQHQAR